MTCSLPPLTPPNLASLSADALRELVLKLAGRNAELERQLGEREAEIARLKGLKGKPAIKPNKPSGMEQAPSAPKGDRRRRRGQAAKTGPMVAREEQIIRLAVPAGSRFKGYQDFQVQELEIRGRVIRYRREHWLTPDGRHVVAPLPAGVGSHVGPQLQRFLLLQYHQGQTTIPRLVAMVRALGLEVSKRQIVRLLTHRAAFVAEAKAVLRAGLETARWITVDDTGARHRAQNGVCTQIGDARFTAVVTTASKSRLNFLEILRAGHGDDVINDEALAYMRQRGVPLNAVARLAEHPDRSCADEAAWLDHLRRIAMPSRDHPLDPVRLATQGAVWGSIRAHRRIPDTVIVSDDAGQFVVGLHALCWVHAERLVHKLDTFTDAQRAAQQRIRSLIWWFYADLKAYAREPTATRRAALRRRFKRIFHQRTGCSTLDRLLVRLRAHKNELRRILDRPDIPLHTNGSEKDIRCHVTRRKVSAGTRSERGRDCRDSFLALMKTCAKLGISFWEFLGDRLGVPGAQTVGYLPDHVRQGAVPA